MRRERGFANTPISLRSLAWIAIAALLGSSVLTAGREVPAGVLVVAGAAIMGALAIGPGRALWSRHEDDDEMPDELHESRIQELEAKLGDQIELEQRVAELENRVDFAERLLAQRETPAELPHHRTPA